MTTQRKTPWQCHSISTHQASHQPIPNNGKWSMRGLTSFLSFLTTAFEGGFQQPIAIQAHRTRRFRLLASVFSQVIDEGDSLCNHSDGSCHDNHNRYHVLVLLPHVSCLLFTLQRYCQRRKERQCISRLFAFTLKSWYASSLWGQTGNHERRTCQRGTYMCDVCFHNITALWRDHVRGPHARHEGSRPRAPMGQSQKNARDYSLGRILSFFSSS